MRAAARAILLAVALVPGAAAVGGMAGCTAMQTTQAPTYAQSLHQGYTTLTAVRRLLAGFVARDRISLDDAIRIRDSLNNAEATLDLLAGIPDQAGLDGVQRMLQALEREMMEAKK